MVVTTDCVAVVLVCSQLDKAAADACQFKAGYDKVTADAAEFKAGYDKLLVDSVEHKAQVGVVACAVLCCC
jgi:hypothetical protein